MKKKKSNSQGVEVHYSFLTEVVIEIISYMIFII